MSPHRVVVVGGGFGGLQAVMKLRRAPVEVVLVDRRNFHLFQPLTYQVATGALSPGQIAYPLRAIFKRAKNVRVVMAEVEDLDLEARQLRLRPVDGVPAPDSLGYDSLIVAGGSHYSFFGHDEWSEFAHEVKSLATQTAKATEEIGRQISGMQAATNESVAAIKEISGTIGRISEISTAIAAAVEEQGAATGEIARNVQQAAAGTTQVASNITEVNRGAVETGSASGQVLTSARSLSSESNHLKSEVKNFLSTIRAA